MGAWLSKVMSALSTAADHNHPVRQALLDAQRARSKIALEIASSGQPSLLSTIIEQVREDDIVIDQPSVGGHTYPLAFGEQMKLSFTLDSRVYTAMTQCLGRVKIESGGGRAAGSGASADAMLFAYRLSLPAALGSQPLRAQPRDSSPAERSLNAEAQLYAPASGTGPVLGRIGTLAMAGATIETALTPAWLTRGRTVFLKAMLPEPVGLMDELVDIDSVQPSSDGLHHAVTIRFTRRINGLADLLRHAAA